MQDQTIVISATFTAKPLQESLDFWVRELGIPARIKFAPYNQVFQQLLDPSSLSSTNHNGFNVILVRFEDWVKSEATYPFIWNEKITRNIRDLALALKTALEHSATPHLICLCPPSSAAVADKGLAALLQEMEKVLESELASLSGAFLATPSELAARYPVAVYDDAHGDELGHLPYTQAFFTSLGTMIARRIQSIQSPPYKVIVLNCDGMLWKGTCAANEIEVDSSRRALREFIVSRHRAGMLICLSSRSNKADVVKAFEAHPDMPLKLDHVVSWRFNLSPPSDNIKSLADELHLGLDSFVFIDKDPIDCAEVQAHSPEVLTVQLPESPDQYPGFLDHIWPLDCLKITEEDRQRTSLYKQNIQRERLRTESLSLEAFLKSLDLKVHISEVAPNHLARVAQLTQRTNQLNFTKISRSEPEIQMLWRSGHLECMIVEVSDRFGDYGIVGVMMFNAGDESINVDTFLLSCRAMGKGVEHRMLSKLGEIAKHRGLDYVDVSYVATNRNYPSLEFLKAAGAKFKKLADGEYRFRFPAEAAARLTYCPKLSESQRESLSSAQSAEHDSAGARLSCGLINRIATALRDVEQVLKVIESQKRRDRPDLEKRYVGPRTAAEELVAGIWAEILRLELVGIQDNFFELGGDSLSATRVMSRVREAFNVRLPLSTMLENATVAGLSGAITRAQSSKTERATAVPRRADRSVAPLSFAQQGIWFFEQFEPNSPLYNIHRAVRFRGLLDIDAFEQSLSEIVRRHEALRTTFGLNDGDQVQIINPPRPINLPMVDLSKLPEAVRGGRAQAVATEEARRPFDLSRGPLFRAGLLRLSDNDHLLLLTVHHIVFDGWSAGVLLQELAAIYEAFATGRPSPLPELPIQYADFAAWQRQWFQGEVLESQLAYWRRQLAGAPAILNLPTDHPRPAVRSYNGARAPLAFDKQLTEALKTLSRQEGVTLFMTLLGAFQTLLARYTQQDVIVVGTPVAGRSRPESELLIGLFISTLVLRTDLSGDPTFRELLGRVREVAMGAYAHQDLSFRKLVEELQPERSRSHTPIFQIMFAFQNVPMEPLKLTDLTMTQFEVDRRTSKVDLSLSLTETSEGLVGSLEYSTDLFEPATIDRMAGHLRRLLEAIVANPDQRISILPLLSDAERRRLIVEWNDTKAEYSKDRCLHHLIEAQAERCPDAIAVVCEDKQLTYKELNSRANQLAHYLQSRGAGPDKLVGVCMERSWETIVGLLGILKAGAAYVPLDPAYPPERLAFMLEDTQGTLLLTLERLLGRLPESEVEVICLDRDWETLALQSDEKPESGVSCDNLAYVMYTSGSTGQPKGVMVPHRAVCNRLLWERPTCRLNNDDAVLQSFSFSFDFSVWEVFFTLVSGARMIVAQPGKHQDSAYLIKLINEHNITVAGFVPSMLEVLLERPEFDACKSLKKVFCGGEVLSVDLKDRFLARLSAELQNTYGPTETCIDVTFWICSRESNQQTVPIGRPIANTQVYILDSQLQPVPVGVPGELHIGGACLACGYLNRPGLTAEKFIPDPFSAEAGARMYKTGDLARYLHYGNIEFLGRIDRQVKIRGSRIELEEVEAVLGQHRGVRETAVVVREDGYEKRLVAYVVASPEQAPTIDQLRSFLKERLPGYMVPSAFILLGGLPLTAGGKVDFRALPAPEQADCEPANEYVTPRNAVEHAVAEVWAEVLRIEQVGIRDNFFDLGGHSLMATRVVSRLRDVFQIDLPLRMFSQMPTVAELSKAIEEAKDKGTHEAPAIVPAVRDAYRVQRRSSDLTVEATIEP